MHVYIRIKILELKKQVYNWSVWFIWIIQLTVSSNSSIP